MPQGMLPFFPTGTTNINRLLAFESRDGQVTYFNFHMPIWVHKEDDKASFKMFTAKLCDQGSATQAEICRAFGVSKISVRRAVKQLRNDGVESFFIKRPHRAFKPRILTTEIIKEVESFLEEGKLISEISRSIGIGESTLRKGVASGRIKKKS